MKNWTIGKRISAGFSCVNIILLLLGIFAYTRLVVIKEHSDEITKQSIPIIELATQAQKNAKMAGQILYQLVGSSDKKDMAQLEGQLADISADNARIYDELDKQVVTEKGKALLEVVKTTRGEYIARRGEAIAVSNQSTNNEAAYQMGRTRVDPAAARYTSALDDLITYVKANTDEASKTIQSAVQSSRQMLLYGVIAASIIGVAIAFVIIKGTGKILSRVADALGEGSEQVSSAATQVSTSSQKLAEGASEQAASIEETSSSLEEMSSMTKRNSENAQKANELAKQARGAADKGASDMQTMSAAMEAIKTSSDDIAKIIKTIDEIAFQTNILALNAAVEAARAGEAGMGFAVVADEVRNLAQRSAQAAKETAGKIEGAIQKTTQGVEISTKVAETLKEIVGKVRQVDDLVAEVASASNEQTQGVGQINTAVGQMDKVTQSNAATAEESASAAEELNAQAQTMKGSVAELLSLVGKDAGRGPVAAAPQFGRKSAPAAPRTVRRTSGRESNGARSAEPAFEMSSPSATRQTAVSAIPMDGDFKDF